jgi:hypothetical protein
MAGEFKRNVGNQVLKKDAKDWIKKFKADKKTDTESVFYGRDAIEAILRDSTVTGISFIFCRNAKDGKDGNDLVMVGTREDGTLTWTNNPPSAARTTTTEDDGSGTYNNSVRCPPTCPTFEP